MRLSRTASVSLLLLFASLWFFAFVNDIGNFWHGGTAAGMIVTAAAAVLGVLAYLEVMRSNAPKYVKVALGVLAMPLAAFAGGAIIYAGKYILAA